MLEEKHYKEILNELESCKRPMFFFDDDPDGLCSFLLLYRHIKEGKGVVVKSSPELKAVFLRSVKDYSPDKIFILDKPLVSEDFILQAKVPVVWIDHHEIAEKTKARYYNSKHNGFGEPVSAICYRAVKNDLWIAMCGSVGDWVLPDFSKEFSKQYPDLLPGDIDRPEVALFESKLGHIVRIFSFILKGNTKDILSCVKILTRINSPYEIMNPETPNAKFIIKRFEKTEAEYKALLKLAAAKKSSSKVLLFSYSSRSNSFTSDLSNELLYMFPEKLIIVAREKNGEMKCSIRSSGSISVSSIIKEALEGIRGYGGGHEYACGACIAKEDFRDFVKKIKDLAKKNSG